MPTLGGVQMSEQDSAFESQPVYADPHVLPTAFNQVKAALERIEHPYTQRDDCQLLFNSGGISYLLAFGNGVVLSQSSYPFIVPSALDQYARAAIIEVNSSVKFAKCVSVREDNGDLSLEIRVAIPVIPAITGEQATLIVQTIVGAVETAWGFLENNLPLSFTTFPSGGESL